MENSKNFQDLLIKEISDAQKILILGIGSELRGDDAVGILLAKKLAKELQQRTKRENKIEEKSKEEKIKVLTGGTAPENLTGEIKNFNPSHIIIIDAAELGKLPGEYCLFKPEETEGITFSTHSLPLKVMSDYLKEYINAKILILGIQPKTLDFGECVSVEITKSIDEIVQAIITATHSTLPMTGERE